MVGGSRIIAFGAGGEEAGRDEFLLTEEVAEAESQPDPDDALQESYVSFDDDGESAEEVGRPDWLFPSIAVGLALAWTAFYFWARSADIASMVPGDWASVISEWAVPVLLIGVVWLIAMRNSRREATRFGDAARVLSDESMRLEERLVAVNRELSLAREFIASQSRDLEMLGRVAVERLSTNADRLQSLIRDNGDRVETIGTVSEAALDNMEKLRGQLPVIANSAKDVTNNIGNAGRTAHGQLEEMLEGFRRLNEFGEASERQVEKLRTVFGDVVGEFTRQCDQIGDMADSRFASLAERGLDFRNSLDAHEAEALAAIRERATALAEELDATRAMLDDQEGESLKSLRARLSTLRDEGGTIARSIRESEERAAQNWRDAIAIIEESAASAAGLIEARSAAAIEDAKERFAALIDQSERAGARIEERNRFFRDQIEEIRVEIEEGHGQSVDAIAERIEGLRDRLAEASLSFVGDIETRRSEAEAAGREMLSRLDDRLRIFDEGVAARSQRFGDELGTRFERLETDDAEAALRLEAKLAAIDEELAERRTAQERHVTALTAHAEAMAAQLEAYEARMAEIATQGGHIETRMAASVDTLSQNLAAARDALNGTEAQVGGLNEASVRLLELIEASAEHANTRIPAVLSESEDTLASMEDRVTRIRETVQAAQAGGDALSSALGTADNNLGKIAGELDRMQALLGSQDDEQQARLAALRERVSEIEAIYVRLAERADGELAQAIERLASSARDAVSAIGEEGPARISELAARLGEESGEALERVVRTKAAEATGQLEQAASHASGVSREAAIQLRDQLAKVDELVGNLERRVAHARERAEEQVDNDFTRRVALITESLNSNAIDIAKALSTDVSDMAWSAYLRGDRGIFTRRAVALLEPSETKAIVQIYERDDEFREHVSRYIHDFEAILRQVLSTRDGHALGVTLLSSDMGKLYVALAQAIERLRN
ncbi:ATPase [Novosphingobium marinum]|uniref:Putative phage infection (PIP) family protein YhgE n=1 Tax=Novosphingobium marinum TaxID=1514948 RepID=A0A7Y9XVY6_9SPHN|nr:ATPase [Novosphingobium marinum]NYH94313.1 putative phage infection (PIP) family protein YhgE [Novosphingobium marinum]